MSIPYVIVGAGLAGLTVAEELLKRGKQVVLLERYPNVGGRALTYHDPDHKIQYEIGAGRIFHTHHRVKHLIRRFRLHTYPISSESAWMSTRQPGQIQQNTFFSDFKVLYDQLVGLPKRVLATHTIAELLPQTPAIQLFLKKYPYWAELFLQRADIALRAFAPSGEMHSNTGFFGIAEGIDMLTTRLREEVVKAGGLLLTRYRVEDIRKRSDGLFDIVGNYGKKADAKSFSILAEKVIIATCRCSLSNFSVLKGKPLLSQLQTSPLTRIYAIYPPNRSTKKVWFEGMPKIITNSPLRFVIPIDAKKGLIMISYTDGPTDTNVWKSLDDSELSKRLQKEIGRLFPDKTIPEPTYVAKHEWPSGCTYWIPDSDRAYDLESALKHAMHPAMNLWVVGESVSFKQAWLEGALESAETLLSQKDL